MTIAINLALLLLGTTGALAAFGGETWKKSDEPLHKRITHRGWLALLCMVATLILGITKEIRTSAAAAESIAKQRNLEENLQRTTKELSETRIKLAAVEPNILQAMVVATAGLRRESDYSTPAIRGESVIRLVSGRTRNSLKLYGGDLLDYNIFCSNAGHRIAGVPSTLEGRPSTDTHYTRQDVRGHLILKAGDTEYPLSNQGRLMIIGPVGRPLNAFILNPNGFQDCSLKILVESADRTREAAQLEPLIQMIKAAKVTATNR